jgi:ankyrin repeat protein
MLAEYTASGVIRGYNRSFELLLISGCNPYKQDACGETPLHIAAHKGNLEKCKLLVQWGANPKLGNNSGYTLFSTALNQKNIELIAYLRKETFGYAANHQFNATSEKPSTNERMAVISGANLSSKSGL